MKLIASASILAGSVFAVTTATAQVVEVATTPVGVVTFVIQSGNTPVAPVFVVSNEFQGQSSGMTQSNGTTTVTFDQSPFTAGEFDEGAEYPKFYAEIADGSFEGFGYDIISNTSDSITIAGQLVDQGLSSTESIVIRPHVTVDRLFENAEGLARRDLIKFFNADGSSDLYNYSGSEWSDGSGERPIYPGTGILTTFSNDVTVTTSGTVKNTKTVVPIYTSIGAINLVSSASPVDVPLDDLNIGAQIERRDLVKFFDPGTLGTAALYNADGAGSLNLSIGTEVSDVFASEAMLITVGNELSITLPEAVQ